MGVQTYVFGQKLHENERILTPGGRARVPGAPLRSATGFITKLLADIERIPVEYKPTSLNRVRVGGSLYSEIQVEQV